MLWASPGCGSPFQANGGCRKGRPEHPLARAASRSPHWPGTVNRGQWELQLVEPEGAAGYRILTGPAVQMLPPTVLHNFPVAANEARGKLKGEIQIWGSGVTIPPQVEMNNPKTSDSRSHSRTGPCVELCRDTDYANVALDELFIGTNRKALWNGMESLTPSHLSNEPKPSQKKLPPLTYEKAVQAVSDQGELKADGRRSTMVYSKAVMTDPSVEHYTQPPRLTFSLHLSPMLAADPAMNGIVSIENASDMCQKASPSALAQVTLWRLSIQLRDQGPMDTSLSQTPFQCCYESLPAQDKIH
ncbi:hypothetical protein UY3_11743 [Chelonia mydas]|uniref:Uncharacterized protein n=1 Tax=Chelonia mydas TaxID=8469 RepID=M7B242_CHEMY|nr:hypothetical protein UY3_11743 [Chelonia mydas]